MSWDDVGEEDYCIKSAFLVALGPIDTDFAREGQSNE